MICILIWAATQKAYGLICEWSLFTDFWLKLFNRNYSALEMFLLDSCLIQYNDVVIIQFNKEYNNQFEQDQVFLVRPWLISC